MVATRPGSDRFSSGSDRSSAAPAAWSIVPIAPSQTSTRSPDSSCAVGTRPTVGPLIPVSLLLRPPGSGSGSRLSLRQRVEDLERRLRDEPVPVVVQPQAGDLLDPLDPVGHRVGVDVQQPRRSLRAVVLPEIAGQGGQVLGLVLVLVLAELTQHFGGE